MFSDFWHADFSVRVLCGHERFGYIYGARARRLQWAPLPQLVPKRAAAGQDRKEPKKI